MNPHKLQKLFDSAKREPAPKAEPGFDQQVMSAIRQEIPARAASLAEQLNALFPRLAVAAATVILLCLAADWALANMSGTDLASGVSMVSEDWLFPTKGF